jgi:peroxiredoxin family protein
MVGDTFPACGSLADKILDVAGRVVFFVSQANFEAAYQAASLGITATAMGDEVYFVFGFDALRAYARDAFGRPHTEREASESARAEGLGVPAPWRMLSEARELGAKVIVCDTTLKLCGLAAADLGKLVDEVMGLAAIWRLTQNARTLSF